MCRISLMMFVVVAVLTMRSAMNSHSVSVEEASVQTSQAVRGGAASCAGELPISFCLGESHACGEYDCVTQNLGFPTYENVHECLSTGRMRNRWFAWTCVTVYSYPGQWWNKEFCGTWSESWCFNRDTCDNSCKLTMNTYKCRSIITKSPPIKEGRFDELRGEGGACQIEYIADNRKNKTVITDCLPSFAQTLPIR